MTERLTPKPRGYIVANGIPIDDPQRLHLSEDRQSVMCGDIVVEPSWRERLVTLRNSLRAELAVTPKGQQVLELLPEIRTFKGEETAAEVREHGGLMEFIKGHLDSLGLSIGPETRRVRIEQPDGSTRETEMKIGNPAVYLENGENVPLVPTLWAEEEDFQESARRSAGRKLQEYQDAITNGFAVFLTFYEGSSGAHGVGPHDAGRIRRRIIAALSSSELDDRLIKMVCQAINGYIPDSEESIEFLQARQIVEQRHHWLPS